MNIDDILGKVPETNGVNMTTSKKFKRDVYDFFNTPEWKEKIGVEFGCFHGHTTIVLCQLFKHVYCYDNWDDAINHAKGFLGSNGVENFTIFHKNLYDGTPLQCTDGDVILIDSKHNYDGVKSDITAFLRFKSSGKKFFILHDYRACPEIRRCVNEFVHTKMVKVEKGIGTYEGTVESFDNWEGVILSEV